LWRYDSDIQIVELSRWRESFTGKDHTAINKRAEKKTLSVLTFEKSEERHAIQKTALRACAETNEWED
jgi:hypothetical protein